MTSNTTVSSTTTTFPPSPVLLFKEYFDFNIFKGNYRISTWFLKILLCKDVLTCVMGIFLKFALQELPLPFCHTVLQGPMNRAWCWHLWSWQCRPLWSADENVILSWLGLLCIDCLQNWEYIPILTARGAQLFQKI